MRLKSYKALTPDGLRRLAASRVGSLTELIAALQGLEVASCLQSGFKAGEQVPLDLAYRRLVACWVDDLRGMIKRFKPSSRLVDFAEAYVSKYLAYELISFLAEGYSYKAVFLPEEVKSAAAKSDYVYEFLGKVRQSGEQLPALVGEVLSRHSRERLKDLNRYLLLSEYEEALYDNLIKTFKDLRADPRALECLEGMKRMCLSKGVIREAFAKGEALKALAGLGFRERTVLERAVASNDPHLLEGVLAFLPTIMCEESLRVLPLDYADLLRFLLLKDWEAFTLSDIVYLVSLGYGPESVEESVKRWLEVYGLASS